MSDFLGWISSICFAFCAIPQAWRSYQEKHSSGLSSWFLGLWLGAEIFYIAAVLGKFGWVHWIAFNVVLNIVCLLVIIRYKLWPKETSNAVEILRRRYKKERKK